MNNRKSHRKSRNSNLLNRVIWLTFTLFLFVGMFGLATVYLRHEAAVLANENKALYAGITEHKRHMAELGAAVARHSTRDELKRLIDVHNLDLRMPKDYQIVHVFEDPTKRLYEKQAKSVVTASTF